MHALSQIKKLNVKIEKLQALVNTNKGTPDELFYLRQLLGATVESGDREFYYKTLVNLADYYSYTNQLDSLMSCLSMADSMAKDQEEIPAALFDIQNHICQYHIVNGDYEIAMNEAISLNRNAEKAGNKNNLVYTNQNIGLIYLFIFRYEEAIPFFERSLSLLSSIEDHNVNFELSLMSYMMYVCLHAGDLDKMKQTLEQYASVLEKNSSLPGKKSSTLYSYYVNYYVAIGDPIEAGKAAQKASQYISKDSGPGYTSVYYLAMARYYHLVADYKKALSFIEMAFEVDPSFEVLEEKMNIQESAGNIDEALKACGSAIKLMEDQNSDAYSRQMNKLHVLYSLNNKAKQQQELADQKEEIARKQKLLFAFLVFVCLLLILVFAMFRNSLRIRGLKNRLEKERNVLKKSTEDLRLAKEQAENADRMKTHFVANISHEIRTPLNAIVGFSGMLNDVTEEEQAEFIHVINTNTELLLKLISDVLDLSQLEADNFILNCSNVNMDFCCQEALETVRHLVEPNVKLTFTHPDVPVTLRTDAARVRQLLVNLLINAAKYTEEGEINLDYKVDEATQQIQFSVTDTGCGIPLDKHEVIFDRFVKVDEFKQGVGLGLSICREIVRRLGGTISVDSSYTSGTRFVFKLSMLG